MNWWQTLIANVLPTIVDQLKTATAPASAPAPAAPATPAKSPDAAVKALQGLLNEVLPAGTPLVKKAMPLNADGWLGDETDKAITLAIALIEPKLPQLLAALKA